MSAQHPITPPPELVEKWANQSPYTNPDGYIATQAAQWGADMELESCCKVLEYQFMADSIQLRAARRPKPPSLNSIALQMLGTIERDAHYIPEITDTIRRALEALDD
jgi:hypothetical protein